MKKVISTAIILSMMSCNYGCSTQAVVTTGKDGTSTTTTNLERPSQIMDGLGGVIMAIGLAGMLISAANNPTTDAASK